MQHATRRETILAGIGAGLAALFGFCRDARALTDGAQAEVTKFLNGARAEPGKIAIDLPEIAENGNTVPLSIAVDYPMTEVDHIAEIMVIAEKNPQPRIATFRLSPMSGRAEAATRIRLASTQNVIVFAKTNQGKVFTEQKEIKVTIGGCGG